MTQKSVRLEFPGSRGAALAAALELPEGPPRAHALFAHCFTCGKDIAAASRISRGLRGRGIAVLRFDFTGLGGSEGDFANTNFSSNVDDLVAAAAYLREHHESPSLLVGHSLGGAAVLVAAARLPEVRAVATIAAPSTPERLRRLLADDVAAIERDGEACVTLAGRRFPIRKQFLDDLDVHGLPGSVRDLGKALVVFHGPLDELVSIDEAKALFDAAKHPKSFVSLDRADHLLSRPADSEFVAATLAAMLPRYLDAPAPDAAAPEGSVVVEEDGAGFRQRIRAGRHALTADEPVAVGGTDAGPTPYDLLLAGLGACTAMTLRMYARHKKLPLEHVAVRLRHEKIHAQDCAECEAETGKVDRIEREVVLRGDLDDAQRRRLLEIADRCPVHRTLMEEKQIVTRAG